MLVTFVMLQCPGLVSREVVISKRYKFMEERKFTTKQIMFGYLDVARSRELPSQNWGMGFYISVKVRFKLCRYWLLTFVRRKGWWRRLLATTIKVFVIGDRAVVIGV